MAKKQVVLEGRVAEVLVGRFGEQRTTPVSGIRVFVGHGVDGDPHAGRRLMDARESDLKKFGFIKGTEIANVRQFSAVSVEELEEIGRRMRLPKAGTIPYGCLGENLVISGILEFTRLPPGTLLFFQKSEAEKRSAVLAVWKENAPCLGPGKVIQDMYRAWEGIGSKFPGAAAGRRGVVGFVYCSGRIKKGDTVKAVLP